MTKYIFAVMLAMLSITATQAQRLMPKQKGLEINAGMLGGEISDNYYLNLTLTVNGQHGGYWIWGAEYSHQLADYRTVQIPLEDYTGEVGYSLQLLSDARKTVTLNAGLTAVAGYESINRGNTVLYDGSKLLDGDNFVYGTAGRLSFETYLSDRFVLLLQGRTKVLWGTDLKQFRPSAGVGLRFNF
ncbi:conjugal transfer protein TraO [Elizabethkingia anophelis]|uniref:conjugal transfer protein TraO n=1 Tax=Bacteroidota TaxID=976 RepID=UPI000CFE2C5B|nr:MULTISPECIES: conjugal transfer protein TraO [Bacteroidota]AVJ52799.1 conjugal transfer protein TraO [Elizabethkingia anophelis]MBB1642553.1 conjugal transfer protein TraO [Sphingobacterium sp. UME9]MDV3551391.1 conjugal transfer protein TraO [Elizabethkingia anophelis]MDV3569781.1 conjugal transfer protein TraO [Elizabethkingia anophelis]MDV3619314.1 conjugal transfer protein TraO [Elizabethkingia anophelis]